MTQVNALKDFKEIAQKLKKGQVGVLPTDTIYGLHTSALNKKAIERVYQIKGRNFNKPCIILISQISDLKQFEINITKNQQELLDKFWPGALSVIFPVSNPEFSYLHRGTNSLAFRIPDHNFLQEVLNISGPLISTSANTERENPAKTIEEAQNYFNDEVDFYVDDGIRTGEPSTVIKFNGEKIVILRQGAAKIK